MNNFSDGSADRVMEIPLCETTRTEGGGNEESLFPEKAFFSSHKRFLGVRLVGKSLRSSKAFSAFLFSVELTITVVEEENKTLCLSFSWDREMKTQNASLQHEELVINGESGVAVEKMFSTADERRIFSFVVHA